MAKNNTACCDHGLCTKAAVKDSHYCRLHTFMDRFDAIDVAHAIRDSLDSMIGADVMVNSMLEHVNHGATITTVQTEGNSGAEIVIALDNGTQFRVMIKKI